MINSGCECCSNGEYDNLLAMQASRILEPHGPYQDCYLDCSFDHPTDSLAQNLCFKACDRRLGPSVLVSSLARLLRE